MCGISGVIDLRGKALLSAVVLRSMNDTLQHRGPDGEGFHIEPGVALGHRRLSIIDLQGGKQPLYNEDHTVVVTYNGEIFNFQEIETELLARGHQFRTRCDTEVIVHAWEEWGERCLERFNGMFAFVLWDSRQQQLFMARDRLGVKPLFYTLLPDGKLVFGSELKAVLAHPAVLRRLDPTAVEDYFTFGYVPDPKTIYRDIKKLPPGTYISVPHGATQLQPHVYWDVPLFGTRIQDLDLATATSELQWRLQTAVQRRLVADVPLGAFLSGGVDSSAVVALMRAIDPNSHILTCAIGFHEPQFDESYFANCVATATHTDHKLEKIEAGDTSLLQQLVHSYDEPYADSSAIPTFRVCALARRHVTVALSGDGGDENFIGYRRYKLFQMEESLRKRIPFGVRKAVFGPLGHFYPKLDWAPRFVRGKTTFQALARHSVEAYLHTVAVCNATLRARLFSNTFKRGLQGYQATEVFRQHVHDKHFEDGLSLAQYLDFKTYLPGDILTKVDRASMAHSLEVRTPFLDYEFVEWAARLPTALKLKGTESKYVLKKSLEAALPHEVLYRKKMGFAVPLDKWFRDSLRTHIAAVVQGPRLAETGIFDPLALQRLVQAHQSGRHDHSAVLWALLMFDGFLNLHEPAGNAVMGIAS